MNSKESRDSLTKVTGRTGTHDSWPLDLDLVVQICSDRVLIGGIHAGSDGSGGFGRGAAAERAGGVLPRRGIASVWRFWGSRARLGLEFGRGGSESNG